MSNQDWRKEHDERCELIRSIISKYSIEIKSEFIPFSKSRNAKKDATANEMSLNWKVTASKGARDIITTDYSAGIGHCPSYKQGARMTIYYTEAIRHECENGRGYRCGSIGALSGKQIKPNDLDVLHSLITDSDVLDYCSFEDWADSVGYGSDSRKAEKIYRQCLEIALKFRNALGDEAMNELREAFQDY